MGANTGRNCIARCAGHGSTGRHLAAPPPFGVYRRARAATGRMAGPIPA
jgi:hypothetical protein